jgi:hypothetical protein
MRLHTNVLTAADVYAAIKLIPGAHAEVETHKSRSHLRRLDMRLTGWPAKGRRMAQGRNDHALTWDEWGVILAALYVADPHMVCGSVKRPVYASSAHYHWATGGRFLSTFTECPTHRWEYLPSDDAMLSHACRKDCGATRRFGEPPWGAIATDQPKGFAA